MTEEFALEQFDFVLAAAKLTADRSVQADGGEDLPDEAFKAIQERYGRPYFLNKKGEVTRPCEPFWAALHAAENIELFEPDEGAFYRYDELTGIYKLVSFDIIRDEISARMLKVARHTGLVDLERWRTSNFINSVIQFLKGMTECRGAFNGDRRYIHMVNGVLEFHSGTTRLVPFTPDLRSRNLIPVPFDPEARCDRFLGELLAPALPAEDVVLLQKYIGQCLLGQNLLQRLLILEGLAGGGKSTFVSVIQMLLGHENVGQIRTHLLEERFELYRLMNKKLAIGVDVQAKFLEAKPAYVIKGLVGGDHFDAELKGSSASFHFQGNLPIIVTSNSQLQINLEADMEAWRRRLLIVTFAGKKPPRVIPKFDQVLFDKEASGILNWAIEGLRLLFADIDSVGTIKLEPRHAARIEALLAESDSVRRFLADSVEKCPDAAIGISELTERYAEYCAERGWRVKSSVELNKKLVELMLAMFQTTKANSIQGEDGAIRGFRRVRFKAVDEVPF